MTSMRKEKKNKAKFQYFGSLRIGEVEVPLGERSWRLRTLEGNLYGVYV